jgi:hypothetical protein
MKGIAALLTLAAACTESSTGDDPVRSEMTRFDPDTKALRSHQNEPALSTSGHHAYAVILGRHAVALANLVRARRTGGPFAQVALTAALHVSWTASCERRTRDGRTASAEITTDQRRALDALPAQVVMLDCHIATLKDSAILQYEDGTWIAPH